MKGESVPREYINGFYQSQTVCDKTEGMCSSYPPIQAVRVPAVSGLFSCRNLLSLSAFSLLQCEKGEDFLFASVIRHSVPIRERHARFKG